MKTKSIIAAVLAAAALAITFSCVKDLEKEDIHSTTEYIGTVVEKSTMKPIEGVQVQITDGTHVYASTETNNRGKFVLSDINFDEVNKDYYLWLDGSALDLPSAQEELRGLGRKIYDYKQLALYDKTDTTLLPQVTTGDVSNILDNSATASGTVLSNGGHALIERGICYATHQSPTIDDQCSKAGSEIGTFNCNITGLQASTTYYIRAYATSNMGTSYGMQKNFTTGDGMPSVTTSSVTSITASSAVCGGNVTFDGGHAITAKGLCWSTTQYPTVTGSHVSLGTGLGQFTGSMTGLSVDTKYYVRAYATNSKGTSYGTQQTFTTGRGLPPVTTTMPTKNGLTVTTGGNISNDGGYAVTARGVCYSRTPYPDLGSAHSHTTDGRGYGSYSSTFTISSTGTYYVRAYATNANGTSYGEQKTINHPYNDLPTFTFGGQTYRVAPPATNTMSWYNANSYCNNLTLYGYSDWRLPTKDELLQMYQDKNTIGGFNSDDWWSGTSWIYGSESHWYVNFRSGYCQGSSYNAGSGDSGPRYVRPVRVEN